MSVDANVDDNTKSITISQTITYQNTSKDTLTTIYLNDWNNSYSSKKTPLAERFEEEFSTKFHLAKKEDRGYTKIFNIKNELLEDLNYKYADGYPDVIEVKLDKPLTPQESYTIQLEYTLILPNATYTDYGFTDEGEFKLKHWYITPAVYDGQWHYYSNKNLDDMHIPVSDVALTVTYPTNYKTITALNEESTQILGHSTTKTFTGKNRTTTYFSLLKQSNFSSTKTDDFTILSNIDEKDLEPFEKAILTDRVTRFLTENLGAYPHSKMVITNTDYNRNPLYGLNQLPDFLRPFPDDFQYEMKILKTALKNHLDSKLIVNPRSDHWVNEGLQIYFLMKYVEDNYPKMKLLGTLADVWGVRAFHASDLSFNYQYYLYSMEMVRKNNDQPITTSKDSLVKFNANIAGKYKTGLGLHYLDDFTQDANLKLLFKDFIEENTLKQITAKDFENYLKNNTEQNIDWFFDEYLSARKKIDFKLMDVKATSDSINFTVKNKRENTLPISLFALKNDTVIDKYWLEDIGKMKSFTIPNNGADKLVLDNDNIIPEFNRRNNYKSTNGSIFGRKPLQFRLFKDIEDPYYNQVFLMPLVEFNNIYDGLTLGAKFYNKTILRKRLNYKFSPQYATRSKSFTGGGTVFYTHNLEDSNLFNITYGISMAYQSFAQDAFFTRIRPTLGFVFRDKDDFRSDKRDFIDLRYVSIERNIGSDATVVVNEPDYGVLNLRYIHSNPGIINFSRFGADFQIADKFSKVSINYEFRKLSENNRNYNFRFYAGTFLENNTDPNSNFFSFALDRPTDYLFDLNYLGRSEDAGLFSQQIIIAEGGFKSKLNPAFANQWMATANFSTSIWRYIQAYGDVGFVKNRFIDPVFVYDSGIRLNLVEDYFEIFFPIYSNLGWEIGQPNYDQKIRFMFTVDPQVLLGLFRRKWY